MIRMPITEILEAASRKPPVSDTTLPSTPMTYHGTQVRHLIDIRTQKRIARKFPRTRKLFPREG